jgi:hypothetical protein
MRFFAAFAFASTLALSASAALADQVLLLPAKGAVPGAMLSSILDNETRYGVIEAGHKLLEAKELEGALRQVPDNNPDTADEYAAMAKFAKADWVVLPTVFQQEKNWRLEVVAYQASGARTETVARDVDTEHVHEQVVEMLKILLRPQGVGTEALPWETGGIKPPAAKPTTPAASSTVTTTPPKPHGPEQPWPRLFVGVGAGVGSAVSRPSGATGTATSGMIVARAGYAPLRWLDVAVSFGDNVSGPRALMFDVSAQGLFEIAGPRFRLGAELGPGVFIAQGGAQSKSFMLRATAVASLNIASVFNLEARVGDLRWVPASSGTVVLAGGSVMGVFRF